MQQQMQMKGGKPTTPQHRNSLQMGKGGDAPAIVPPYLQQLQLQQAAQQAAAQQMA